MTDDNVYPEYQYSIKLPGKDEEMIVIRKRTLADLIEAKKQVDLILGKKTEGLDPEIKAQANAPYQNACPLHPDKELEQKVNRSTGQTFYSHYMGKNEDGKNWYCNGR